MRITKKDFLDLGIWMVLFGIIIGIIFPFFMLLLGVEKTVAMTLPFFALCILAGILVGIVNIVLAKSVIGKKLRMLIKNMKKVEGNLISLNKSTDIEDCNLEDCLIKVNSIDEIGQSAEAFNNLTISLYESIRLQGSIREYQTMITSNLQISFLAENSLIKIMDFLNATAGALYIENNGELEIKANRKIDQPEILASNELVIKAFEKGEQIVIKKPENIKINNLLVDFIPNEILVEPILYKGIALGVIILASVDTFNEKDKMQLSLFTNSLSLAVNNSIEHSQLQELVAIDPLTKAYNRRFGMKRLKEEYIRSVRNGNALGVMMLDIDDFKKVNDTYGHMTGDKVLIALAEIIQSTLRESDVLMRYGGEEFMVILPGASFDDTYKIAERIRRIISDFELKFKGSIISVTISIGVSSYPEIDVENEEKLIVIADNALYKAKDSGKNRVERGS